jgi:sphingosine kinase
VLERHSQRKDTCLLQQHPFFDDDAYPFDTCGEITTVSMASDNPFIDPLPSFDEQARDHSFALDSTLAVGKNASLTLGTDSLILLGELDVLETEIYS